MRAAQLKTAAAHTAKNPCAWLCLALAWSSACSSPRPKLEQPRPPLPATAAHPRSTRLLDDFEQPTLWQTVGSDGVSASREQAPGQQGHGLRLRFDFRGHAGYATLRRALPLTLPANYE